MSLSLSCWAADMLLAGWKEAGEGLRPAGPAGPGGGPEPPAGGASPGGGAMPGGATGPETPVGVGVSVVGPRSNRWCWDAIGTTSAVLPALQKVCSCPVLRISRQS